MKSNGLYNETEKKIQIEKHSCVNRVHETTLNDYLEPDRECNRKSNTLNKLEWLTTTAGTDNTETQ